MVVRWAMPLASSADVVIATCAPAMIGFQYSLRAVDAARHGKVRAHIAIENRNPVQPKQQLLRTAERELGADVEVLDIEIRLIKAIEQHQRIGPGVIEFHGQVRNACVLRGELHRNRKPVASLT